MNKEEYLDIVDVEDMVIDKKLRSEITKPDIYRVSSLWVFDKDKNLLISQRPKWKKHAPGKWTESAVGTVEHGETYESNLVKEAKEELGLNLKNSDLIFISKQFHESNNGKMFGTMFAVILNKILPKVGFNKHEVSNIEWIAHDDLLMQLKEENNRFVKDFNRFYTEVWDKVS